jgi:hypothetical protein
MRRIDRIFKMNCWMDVFEQSYFGGKMRRLFGPVRIEPVLARSVIVGPQARVQMIARHRKADRQIIVQLRPNSLVPHLSASLRGATLKSATITCRQGK